MSPSESSPAAPVLSRAAAREVDRRALEVYGIPGLILMENAARAVVERIEAIGPSEGAVTMVCGPGNNGGDGYAVARHLHNAGRLAPRIVVVGRPRPGSDAAVNASIVARMGIPTAGGTEVPSHWRGAGLIVDALFGTGLARPVEGAARAWIDWMNEAGSTVLAVDVPSGLDADSGAVLGAAVRADETVTFVAEKRGFRLEPGRSYVGRVTVADIGAPPEILASLCNESPESL